MDSVETTVLLRPVSAAELRLIALSGYRRFPPRSLEQPIFYPVCTEQYGLGIAQEWNAREDAGGAVTRFSVRTEFLANYVRRVVGARHEEEYGIPSEDLDALNDALVGPISVLREFPPAAG